MFIDGGDECEGCCWCHAPRVAKTAAEPLGHGLGSRALAGDLERVKEQFVQAEDGPCEVQGDTFRELEQWELGRQVRHLLCCFASLFTCCDSFLSPASQELDSSAAFERLCRTQRR